MNYEYTVQEKRYILDEFTALAMARQEPNNRYPDEVLREWVKSFIEDGYNAEHVCRMIRYVKLHSTSFKIKYADFTNCDPDDLAKIIPIIPIKQLEAPEPEQPKMNDEHSLLSRVRTNLGISYFDFCSEADKENTDWEVFYRILLDNPDEIDKRKMKRLIVIHHTGKEEDNLQKLSTIKI